MEVTVTEVQEYLTARQQADYAVLHILLREGLNQQQEEVHCIPEGGVADASCRTRRRIQFCSDPGSKTLMSFFSNDTVSVQDTTGLCCQSVVTLVLYDCVVAMMMMMMMDACMHSDCTIWLLLCRQEPGRVSPKVDIERCTFFVEFMATQEHGTGNEGDSFKTCHLNSKQICLFKSGRPCP